MSKIDAKTFLAQNQQAQFAHESKLHQFKDDIIFLKEQGMPEKKILEFLSLQGVTISQPRLNVYINKNLAGLIRKTRSAKPKSSKSSGSASVASEVRGPDSKPRDPAKPSWVPDHLDADELLSKN